MTKIRRIDYSPDEMIAGIAGQLDALDFGVYWMICTLIYSRGGPIRDDEKWISRVFRNTNPRTVRASIERLVATSKVVRKDGELMVNRCRTEIESSLNRVRKAAENGSKGGRPSNKNNDIPEPGGFSDEKLTINHQPSTITDAIASDAGARDEPGKPGIEAEFRGWYADYPHKVGKGQAEKAYRTARRKVTADELRDGLRRYIRTKPPDRQWCNPATWLNGERWADAPADTATTNGVRHDHASGKVGRKSAAIDAILGAGREDPGERELFRTFGGVVRR